MSKLDRIKTETKFLLDVPEENSTTGHAPTRGVYTRMQTDKHIILWFDSKGRLIPNENWCKYLETEYNIFLYNSLKDGE